MDLGARGADPAAPIPGVVLENRDRDPPPLRGPDCNPLAGTQHGRRRAPAALVEEPAHRRVNQLLEHPLEPRSVERGDLRVVARRRPEQPRDERDVADVVEDRPDAVRVGDRRLDPRALDLGAPLQLARRAANLPPVLAQRAPELPPPAPAADEERSRHAIEYTPSS